MGSVAIYAESIQGQGPLDGARTPLAGWAASLFEKLDKSLPPIWPKIANEITLKMDDEPGASRDELDAQSLIGSLTIPPEIPSNVQNLIAQNENPNARLYDSFKKSPDGKWDVFRIVAGDWNDNHGAGLMYVVPSGGDKVPRLLCRGQVSAAKGLYPSFYFIGFLGDQVLISNGPDLYLADLKSEKVEALDKDAWNTAISLDHRRIAFCSSYRTEASANLWLLDLATRRKQKLTQFVRREPGHGIRWLSDDLLAFEMGDDTGGISSWTVQVNGKNLTLLGNGQLGDFYR